VATTAGALNAKYVIHAVGPVYQGGRSNEDHLLASAYRAALLQAMEMQCESVALPALSTGAFNYPLDEAARIAVDTARDHARAHALPRVIRFVLFDARAMSAFESALALDR
jgi:O-acetyl-ADP-ribose deacetylase (regulator of RNase III)